MRKLKKSKSEDIAVDSLGFTNSFSQVQLKIPQIPIGPSHHSIVNAGLTKFPGQVNSNVKLSTNGIPVIGEKSKDVLFSKPKSSPIKTNILISKSNFQPINQCSKNTNKDVDCNDKQVLTTSNTLPKEDSLDFTNSFSQVPLKIPFLKKNKSIYLTEL